MEFRVLGPLEATEDGVALPLGGPTQRLVLAYLILDANRVVATDQLIDRIWGEEPPDTARTTLAAYISRLRKLLGAERIETRAPGYVLVAARAEIDVLRFTDLVDAARRTTDDRAAAAELLTQALDLWRGDALSDLSDHDALRPAITRLEELRLEAQEDRIGADLDLGRDRQSVPLLEHLTSEYPLRERLWSLLILALYRSGRQGDALGAFHRARTTLLEELGIDPSPELRRLHEQVLNQDPALDLAAISTAVAAASPPVEPSVEPPVKPAPAGPADRRQRRPILIALGAVALLASVAAASWVTQRPSGLPDVGLNIGLDMPLTGDAAVEGVPVRDAVQMAVDDLNAAGGIDGVQLGLVALDDEANPDRAAENARTLVANSATVAMIGPWGSAAAYPVLPITNEAGLLQCSPSSTYPGLTKPRYGALDLRTAHPESISFIRLPPSDDIQAFAMASFAYHNLGARSALVIDDTQNGRDVADAFAEEFGNVGGTTVRQALNPGADPALVLTSLTGANPPDMVFFGGYADDGAAVRLAMADAGHAATPLLSWDGLMTGTGSDTDSYIHRVGPDLAVGSYVAHASLPDEKFSFADAYRHRFGVEPDEFSAAGYACAEIIFDALRAAAPQNPSVEDLRNLVRAYAVDPAHRYETVLGTVGFDANGDALQQFVTFYRVEASAAEGAGDWVIFKKQDFGPAP